ncbi:translation initiation factor [Oscillatoria amoena NRMC-F 0135]|nr:translation initiation factor [Oscillatoria amoena NRMC-F 0135]
MAKKNEWKQREGVVYSTNNDFQFETRKPFEVSTRAPKDQYLRVLLDKSGRAGKQVTLVTGFVGSKADLEALGKLLKAKCGVGGSVKDGEIIVQGDQRDKIIVILTTEGYKSKRIG